MAEVCAAAAVAVAAEGAEVVGVPGVSAEGAGGDVVEVEAVGSGGGAAVGAGGVGGDEGGAEFLPPAGFEGVGCQRVVPALGAGLVVLMWSAGVAVPSAVSSVS